MRVRKIAESTAESNADGSSADCIAEAISSRSAAEDGQFALTATCETADALPVVPIASASPQTLTGGVALSMSGASPSATTVVAFDACLETTGQDCSFSVDGEPAVVHPRALSEAELEPIVGLAPVKAQLLALQSSLRIDLQRRRDGMPVPPQKPR